MRSFIAIALPEEIRHSLGNLQEELKSYQADVNWVKPENIHLTLKFLGEITEKTQSEIKGICDNCVQDQAPFRLRLSTLGAFPKLDLPRVIWVGIDPVAEKKIKILAQKLEDKIKSLGVPAEKREFSSHITIGRVRSALNRDNLVNALSVIVENFSAKDQEFPVDKIILFKSTLTPQGPLYETIYTANFRIN